MSQRIDLVASNKAVGWTLLRTYSLYDDTMWLKLSNRFGSSVIRLHSRGDDAQFPSVRFPSGGWLKRSNSIVHLQPLPEFSLVEMRSLAMHNRICAADKANQG